MRHVRLRLGTPLLAAALAPSFGACGHRGDPKPPLRHTPPPLQEFRLAQRGSTLEVSVLAPAASVDGIAYQSLAVEFVFVEGQKDLEKAGTRRAVLALPRERVVETRPLPPPGTVARAAARGLFEKEKGPRTLTMALVAQAEVQAPRDLAASLTDNGVRLAWTGEIPEPVAAAVQPPRVPGMPGFAPRSGPNATPAAPTPAAPTPTPSAPTPESPPAPSRPAATPPAGEDAAAPGESRLKAETKNEEVQTGFHVYRRVGSASYAQALTSGPLDKRAFRDATAPQGEKICYVVRAVASVDPLVESAASNEACLEVRDITPPAMPTGLAVLPREKGLELVWTPSAEEDLARYRVYREAPGEPRKKVAEVDAAGAGWTDATAKPGVVYQYALTAVDRSGNESPATPAVEASLQ